ncbi:MAG: hypothetical protein R3301_18310 [Saprospiraceae bacterium]|nr:hypothetical protein [Saprospiraceae bacterium]
MRKQYHFRPSRKGFYAWDVDRLIEQSHGLPVIEVKLSEISTAQDFGPVTDCRSFAEHMQLVEETDLAYPIILCPENRVMDGLHRVIKAYRNGDDRIKAVRFEAMPKPDYEDVYAQDLPYDADARQNDP